MPSGDQHADIERDLAQTSLHRAQQIRAPGALCSGNPCPGIPLVPQLPVPSVDPGIAQLAIGLEGANDVPAITPNELDQLARRIPAVEQDIDRVSFRKIRPQVFQHLLCQAVLALEPQTLLLGPIAVEPTHGLLSQVEPPGKGVTIATHLQAASNVNSSLAVDRLPFSRCRVVKDPVRRLTVCT